MALNLAYNFAWIDPETNMCLEVRTTSSPNAGNEPNLVPIPEYNTDYIFKYYIDGAWYEDAAGTIPWSPSET